MDLMTESASMRPRVFPAEDVHSVSNSSTGSPGFNEAAGIPRGRRTAAYPHLRGNLRLQ